LPASSVVISSVVPASPAALATTPSVVFTPAASGGSGTYEYQLWVQNPSTGTWTSSAYSAAPLTWNTTGLATGTYNIQIWARNVGSSAGYEAYTTTTFTLN